MPSRPSRYAVALRASLDRMPAPRQGLRKQIRRGVSAGAPLPTVNAEAMMNHNPSYLPPPVTGRELVPIRCHACQKPAPQRRIGNECDAQFAAYRKCVFLRVTRPERVFGLKCCDRMDGMGTTDRCLTRFGKADRPHLARFHEAGHGADSILDRYIRVDPVDVVKVDDVDLQVGQAAGTGARQSLSVRELSRDGRRPSDCPGPVIRRRRGPSGKSGQCRPSQ